MLRTEKRESETVCDNCDGCGLYLGKLCVTCNGHGCVILRQTTIGGAYRLIAYDIDPELRKRGVV